MYKRQILQTTISSDERVYGIAIGGDIDGIYGDGSSSNDDAIHATNSAGQGVVVLTQGRCLARVVGPVTIGQRLASDDTDGVLKLAVIGDYILAMALNEVQVGDFDMIAVDFQGHVSLT